MFRFGARPRSILVAGLLGLGVNACSGISSAALMAMMPKDEDQYARSQIHAIADGNTRSIEQALDPSLRSSGAPAQLAEMTKVLAGSRIESMEVIGYQGQVFNGVSHQNISYQLRLSNGWAVANIASRTEDGRRVIEGATVRRIPERLEKTNAFTLAGKGPAHYLVLALAIGIPALMLYAVVLVFRMPLRRRWLWVLASLAGVGQWSLNWTTGEMGGNPFNLQLLGAGVTRVSQYAPWILAVSLPIGALYVVAKYHRGRWRMPVYDAPREPVVETPV
jgi:hypothetical protein